MSAGRPARLERRVRLVRPHGDTARAAAAAPCGRHRRLHRRRRPGGAALHLLAAGRAKQLLLSGVGGGAELRDLAFRADINPAPLAGRVTLGRSATSTHGNATETAAWAHARSIHSLIVVTAFYHMPRALAELRRVLPHVALYPDPVLMPKNGWIGHIVTLRLLAEEYTKYLVVVSGLSTWLPVRDPPFCLDITHDGAAVCSV